MAAQTVSFLNSNQALGRSAALDEAVRSLVSMTFVHGRFRVEMPVVLATGSAVTVVVWPEGSSETFLVSDDGAALFEVMAGAFNEATFRRVAKEKCDQYGAHFDGGSMIYLRVSQGKLRGAIVAMGNLIKEVVDETIERSVSQKAREIDFELWDKLEHVFHGLPVSRRASLAGESTALHEFTAVVETEKGVIAFETFSAQGNSINSVYAKMSDIGRSDSAPKGVAVTRRFGAIGPKLNLVTSVSQVIEISIESSDLRKLAFAA